MDAGTVVEELDALVARVGSDAVALAALPLDGLDARRAATAHRALRLADDRLRLVASTLLAKVEAEGAWDAPGGARTLPEWAARRDGVSYGAARREVTLGRALEGGMAATRAAVAAGEITLEHAQVLAEVAPTSEARRATLGSDQEDRNEAHLLAAARRLGVDEFRRVVRRWAVAVDDRAAEREHQDADARQFLTLGRRRDGVALSGFLTHENGAVLATALRAVGGVPAKDDARSAEQRAAAALAGAARLVLDKGLSGSRAQVRPHLSVLVPYETLERLAASAQAGAGGESGVGAVGGAGAVGDDGDNGDSDSSLSARTSLTAQGSLTAPAELESGEPLPHSVLQRIACDAEVTRIVFGADGTVLDVGRAQRTYAKQLRRAVVARDRHCRYPGCSAAPDLGEVHHIRWWSRGGPTSVENGVLLCWYHHDLVHQRDLRIARTAGGYEVRRADGGPLLDPRRVPRPGPSPEADRPPPTKVAARAPELLLDTG